MDPSVSPPSVQLHQSIAAALEAYRETCFQITFSELREAVASTNASIDDDPATGKLEEEEDRERFADLKHYHFGGFDTQDTFSEEKEEEVGAFNSLLEHDVARRVLHNVAPPPINVVTKTVNTEQLSRLFAELQRRVCEKVEEATLPAEYHALAALASKIFPPGLLDRLGDLDMMFPISISGEEVPNLDKLDRRFDFADAGWKVYVGFFNGYHALKDCHHGRWALCDHRGGDYTKDTSKKWRIVFAYLGSPLYTFNSVETLLRWIAGKGVRAGIDWDSDAEDYI